MCSEGGGGRGPGEPSAWGVQHTIKMGDADSTVSDAMETVVQETVRTMRQFRHVAVVQAQACLALYNLTAGNEHKVLLQRTEAVQAGAFEAVLAAMNTHPDQSSMLQWAMRALLNMVSGGDDITAERKQRAMAAGILSVVSATMQRGVEDESLQLWACGTLLNLASGSDYDAVSRGEAILESEAMSQVRLSAVTPPPLEDSDSLA